MFAWPYYLPGIVQVQEQKGLDMVRRDWCPLSKDVGNFALGEILSAKPKEDVVAAIHDHLNKASCLFLLASDKANIP